MMGGGLECRKRGDTRGGGRAVGRSIVQLVLLEHEGRLRRRVLEPLCPHFFRVRVAKNPRVWKLTR